MSENNQNINAKNDEIDILDLFRRMGKTLNQWANAIGRAILISFVFLLRRWLPIGLSLALGVGVSYLLKGLSSSFYTSDLVLRTNPVSTSDMISYVNRLQKFSKENNDAALAEALSIEADQVNRIIDIGAYWIIDKYKDGIPDFVDYKYRMNNSDSAYYRMNDRLDIRVITTNTMDLPNLRNGIIKFINSDSLFQQHNRVRLRHNNELLTRLKYDILQLDSLQRVKYFEETRNLHPQSGGQMIFLQEQKTQLVYTDIYSLYARKQAIEVDCDLYKDIVTVLSDFSITIERVNGGLFYGKTIIPAFFLLTLLMLIIQANWKSLKDLLKKY
jgi:hypothetical protein